MKPIYILSGIIVIAILITIALVSAYTADNYWEVALVLSGDSYTADNYWEVELVLGEVAPPEDTCTCPGDSSAHEFDCSDNCIVSTCTAGDVTFTGSGNVTCTGTWDIDSWSDPGSGCILYFDSACYIDE